MGGESGDVRYIIAIDKRTVCIFLAALCFLGGLLWLGEVGIGPLVRGEIEEE